MPWAPQMESIREEVSDTRSPMPRNINPTTPVARRRPPPRPPVIPGNRIVNLASHGILMLLFGGPLPKHVDDIVKAIRPERPSSEPSRGEGSQVRNDADLGTSAPEPKAHEDSAESKVHTDLNTTKDPKARKDSDTPVETKVDKDADTPNEPKVHEDSITFFEPEAHKDFATPVEPKVDKDPDTPNEPKVHEGPDAAVEPKVHEDPSTPIEPNVHEDPNTPDEPKEHEDPGTGNEPNVHTEADTPTVSPQITCSDLHVIKRWPVIKDRVANPGQCCVSSPIPDMLYGYQGQTAFRNHLPQLFSIGDNPSLDGDGFMYPFLVMEFKGCNRPTSRGTNQPLKGAALCIKVAERLNTQLEKSNRDLHHPINSLAFGVAVGCADAELFVSWKHNHHVYYTATVCTFYIAREGDYAHFRKYVDNIIEWGRSQRLTEIRSSLDTLAPKSPGQSA